MRRSKFVVIMSILVFMLAACSSKAPSTSAPASKSEPASVVESTSEPEADSSEEASEPQEEASNAIGDTAALGDWEISVTDMQIVDSISNNAYLAFTPDEGNKYIHVFVTVSNNGKSSDTFLPSFGLGDAVTVKLLYGDGYEYSASNLLGYDNELHDTSLNPLSSVDKELAFSVPEKVSTSEDSLIIKFSSGRKSVRFKIR